MFALPFPWLPVAWLTYQLGVPRALHGQDGLQVQWVPQQPFSQEVILRLPQCFPSATTFLILGLTSYLSTWLYLQKISDIIDNFLLCQVTSIGLGHCWFHILYWDDTRTCSCICTLTFPLSLSFVTFPFWPILFHWLIIINRFFGMDSSSPFASAAHSGRGREHFKLPQCSCF